ncbi:DKNYY domain-containing protein [Hymenobacter glaciei]|uniref:DKNYY domain-containing protein n=1 Tax=Hymenobacter glaciei TaxID=877209 RepID=UPI0031E8DB0E
MAAGRRKSSFFAFPAGFVYLLLQTSEWGMLIAKLDKADVKSFKLLEGNYLFAVDKHHVFKDGAILENIDSKNLKVERDKHGEIVSVR